MLRLREYKRLSPRLFEILWNRFTFQDGGMRGAMQGRREQYMIIAFANRKIIGWAMVYRGFYTDDDNVYSVGVFVGEKYRHLGIGSLLRQKAETWALRRNYTTFWYDAKNAWAAMPVEAKHDDPTGIGAPA